MTNEPYNQLTCQPLSPNKPQIAPHLPYSHPRPNADRTLRPHSRPNEWQRLPANAQTRQIDPPQVLRRASWTNHRTDSPGGSAAQRTRGYLVDDSKRKEAAKSRGQPGTKAPTIRTNSHTTTRSSVRAGALHPLRDDAPDQKRCIAYGSGAVPQHTRINAELANRVTPAPQQARAQGTRRTSGGY